jgi:hypothetical protein
MMLTGPFVEVRAELGAVFISWRLLRKSRFMEFECFNLYQRSVVKYSFLDVAHPPARVFAPAGGCGNSSAIMVEMVA